MLAILLVQIDPVIFKIGSVSATWYGLSYAISMVICIYLFQKLSVLRDQKHAVPAIEESLIDSLVLYSIIGMILGGRLGYVSFYRPEWFIERPLMVLNTVEGGMSFHGAVIGMFLTFLLFCKKNKVNFLSLTDLICTVASIGLFLGRCANFINGELYGRPTDGSWGVIFPYVDSLPRHPSQLYEAGLEGIVLFSILIVLFLYTKVPNKRGFLSGVFLIGYGIARTIVENFREPDLQNGSFMLTIWHNYALEITKGQLLTLPMIVVGTLLLLKQK